MFSVAKLDFYNSFIIFEPHFVMKIEDGELMQFIGLTDKNEKDIFNGDLLKHNGKIYKVNWSHGCFYLVNIENIMEASCFGDIDLREEKNPDGFEIIGNVWENPELLKGGE